MRWGWGGMRWAKADPTPHPLHQIASLLEIFSICRKYLELYWNRKNHLPKELEKKKKILYEVSQTLYVVSQILLLLCICPLLYYNWLPSNQSCRGFTRFYTPRQPKVLP